MRLVISKMETTTPTVSQMEQVAPVGPEVAPKRAVSEDPAPVSETAEKNSEDPAEESAPDESAEDIPIKTVKDRLADKLSNSQTELTKNQQLRKTASEAYNEKIASLKFEYMKIKRLKPTLFLFSIDF